MKEHSEKKTKVPQKEKSNKNMKGHVATTKK